MALNRTTQIQPGVYFTFEAPYLRILMPYSSALEGPGIISNERGIAPTPSILLRSGDGLLGDSGIHRPPPLFLAGHTDPWQTRVLVLQKLAPANRCDSFRKFETILFGPAAGPRVRRSWGLRWLEDASVRAGAF